MEKYEDIIRRSFYDAGFDQRFVDRYGGSILAICKKMEEQNIGCFRENVDGLVTTFEVLAKCNKKRS